MSSYVEWGWEEDHSRFYLLVSIKLAWDTLRGENQMKVYNMHTWKRPKKTEYLPKWPKSSPWISSWAKDKRGCWGQWFRTSKRKQAIHTEMEKEVFGEGKFAEPGGGNELREDLEQTDCSVVPCSSHLVHTVLVCGDNPLPGIGAPATLFLEQETAAHSSVLTWRIPGTRSLVGCCLWGRTESDTTEAT